MCGINGFTYQDSDLLRRMHATTRHRGSDDEGLYESPRISLAHNRLSIIDLSAAGRQPMRSPCGRYTLVFNGEIYNYQEIRADMEREGEVFATETDTEVLLRLFMRDGERGFTRLNGMFAFAVWDAHEEVLTLARDPMGMKPLYYRVAEGRLWFSSEMHALSQISSAELSPQAVQAYLRLLYIPSPMTMLRDVHKLSPGHVLTWKHGECVVQKYTFFESSPAFVSRHEAVRAVRETMTRAVRRHMISDRPVGIFLSGGIDSTIVASIASEQAASLQSYTVEYVSDVEQQKYNADAIAAQRTAAQFGLQHHRVQVTAEDVVCDIYKIAQFYDEPLANLVCPSTYFLAQRSCHDMTVALGGDGADELFAGYARYWYQHQLQRCVQCIGERGVRQLSSYVPSRYRAWFAMASRRMNTARHLSFIEQKEQDWRALLAPPVLEGASTLMQSVFDPYFCTTDDANAVASSMWADAQTWLADESHARTDRMTMAHGMEFRVPFLDAEMVRVARRIPIAWNIDSRQRGKKLLIEAFRDVLPQHVLRAPKSAFLSPMSKWIRGALRPFIQETLALGAQSELQHYIRFDEVQRRFERHCRGEYHVHAVWAVAMLTLWHQQLKRRVLR